MSAEDQSSEIEGEWWPHWASCEQPGFVIDDNFIMSTADVFTSPIDTYRRRKAAREICALCPVFEECEQNAENHRDPYYMQYGRVYAGKISVLLPVIGVVRI